MNTAFPAAEVAARAPSRQGTSISGSTSRHAPFSKTGTWREYGPLGAETPHPDACPAAVISGGAHETNIVQKEVTGDVEGERAEVL